MAVRYLATPVDGVVGEELHSKPKRILVRSRPHDLDLVSAALRNAWLPEIGPDCRIKWFLPPGKTEFIASVYTKGTIDLIATIIVEEMEV